MANRKKQALREARVNWAARRYGIDLAKNLTERVDAVFSILGLTCRAPHPNARLEVAATAIGCLEDCPTRKQLMGPRKLHKRWNPKPFDADNVISLPGPNTEKEIKNFYDSWEWKRLSYDVKLERGRRCECCGAAAPKVRIITDHIKPLRKFWHLRLDRANLQVLCDDCNMGKGSRDQTDFRVQPC